MCGMVVCVRPCAVGLRARYGIRCLGSWKERHTKETLTALSTCPTTAGTMDLNMLGFFENAMIWRVCKAKQSDATQSKAREETIT